MAPLRTMSFDETTDTYVIRDTQSVVRAILYNQRPFVCTGATAVDAAIGFLQTQSEQLGLPPPQLGTLHLRPQDDPRDGEVFSILNSAHYVATSEKLGLSHPNSQRHFQRDLLGDATPQAPSGQAQGRRKAPGPD